MTLNHVVPATTCSVSGRWDSQTGGGAFLPNRSSASRRAAAAAAARLSSSASGSNSGLACSFSVDFKPRNIISTSSPETAQRGYGGYQRREAGRAARALAVAVAVAVQEEEDIYKAKYGLLNVLLDTDRGLSATPEQRAIVEEALVGVEKFDAGTPLELEKLDGTWLLQYTTAPDVLQILQAAETPFFRVGQIFQKFECVGRTDGGVVRNVVRWSIPRILQDDDGATLVVTAKFSVVSPRSIALSFEEAQLGQIAISDDLQAFLAPAVLPRTFLNLEVLQFFRTLNVRVPLFRPSNPAENDKRVPVGLWYYLTYLDNDMLVGRALGNGGLFIFTRTQQLQLP